MFVCSSTRILITGLLSQIGTIQLVTQMTQYKIAASATDYRKAHELVKSEGLPDHPLNFPTVMAIQGDEVVGILGTDTSGEFIIAGPLVLKGDRLRAFTLIRLIDFYDAVMREAGVTAYIFSVEDGNTKWIDKIDKTFSLSPYAHKDGRAFYVRNL